MLYWIKQIEWKMRDFDGEKTGAKHGRSDPWSGADPGDERVSASPVVPGLFFICVRAEFGAAH